MHLLKIFLGALLLGAGAQASALPSGTVDAAVAPRSPDNWFSDVLEMITGKTEKKPKKTEKKPKKTTTPKPRKAPQLKKRPVPLTNTPVVYVWNAKKRIPARICPSMDKSCVHKRDFLDKNKYLYVACKFQDPKSKKMFYKDIVGLYYEAGTPGHPFMLLPVKDESWVPKHMHGSGKNMKKLKECKVGIQYCPPDRAHHGHVDETKCAEVGGRPGSCLDGGFFKTAKGFDWAEGLDPDRYYLNRLAYCEMYAKRTETKGGKVVCSDKIAVTPPPPEDDYLVRKYGAVWPQWGVWEPKMAESKKVAGFVCW